MNDLIEFMKDIKVRFYRDPGHEANCIYSTQQKEIRMKSERLQEDKIQAP